MCFTQAQPSRRQPHYRATSEAAHDNDDLHELCREALSRQARRFHSAKPVLGKVGTHSSLFFIFPYKIIVNSTDWTISSLLDWPIISTGGKKWSFEADLWWDVEQVLLAEHDLPKDDGRERIPWKPDRWVETVSLQVNVRFEQGLSGQRPLTVGGRWDPLWIVFVTGTMDLSCGTPCITTLRKLSTAVILVNK